MALAWVYERLTLEAGPRGRFSAERSERLRFLRRALACPSDEIREHARLPARGLAEFEFRVGRLVDIGAGGLGISATHPPAPGCRTRIRVTDPDTGICYVFPCEIVWRRQGDNGAFGAKFCGPPRRVSRAMRG